MAPPVRGTMPRFRGMDAFFASGWVVHPAVRIGLQARGLGAERIDGSPAVGAVPGAQVVEVQLLTEV